MGQFVEFAETDELFDSPFHPYTQALMSAIPVPDPEITKKRRIILPGETPSPINPPEGCRFKPRCIYSKEYNCKDESPELVDVGDQHFVACKKM
jgi:oligopeptide transport system ATP-binding protein